MSVLSEWDVNTFFFNSIYEFTKFISPPSHKRFLSVPSSTLDDKGLDAYFRRWLLSSFCNECLLSSYLCKIFSLRITLGAAVLSSCFVCISCCYFQLLSCCQKYSYYQRLSCFEALAYYQFPTRLSIRFYVLSSDITCTSTTTNLASHATTRATAIERHSRREVWRSKDATDTGFFIGATIALEGCVTQSLVRYKRVNLQAPWLYRYSLTLIYGKIQLVPSYSSISTSIRPVSLVSNIVPTSVRWVWSRLRCEYTKPSSSV